jgi:NarL family two-component system response regulator LiaR
MSIRVLIADDHAVVRQGLRTFLELQEDIEVVEDVADGAAAVAAVERQAPDVVLMDLVMPGMDGVEAIRRIRELRPQARVLVLSSFLDDERLFPTVHGGEALLHPAVAARLMDEFAAAPATGPNADGLTEREREVLTLIARGLPNKLIARDLSISEKTVKTHVSSILGKLGLTDRTQAALYAVRSGLVES